MLSLKSGVNCAHLSTGVLLGLLVAERVFDALGYKLVITSGLDGEHSKTSLHYAGEAVDLRTRHVQPQHLPLIVDEIRKSLGENYDVVLEATHLHVEHQPRRVDDGVR